MLAKSSDQRFCEIPIIITKILQERQKVSVAKTAPRYVQFFHASVSAASYMILNADQKGVTISRQCQRFTSTSFVVYFAKYTGKRWQTNSVVECIRYSGICKCLWIECNMQVLVQNFSQCGLIRQAYGSHLLQPTLVDLLDALSKNRAMKLTVACRSAPASIHNFETHLEDPWLAYSSDTIHRVAESQAKIDLAALQFVVHKDVKAACA